jgi:hypothetical protein
MALLAPQATIRFLAALGMTRRKARAKASAVIALLGAVEVGGTMVARTGRWALKMIWR